MLRKRIRQQHQLQRFAPTGGARQRNNRVVNAALDFSFNHHVARRFIFVSICLTITLVPKLIVEVSGGQNDKPQTTRAGQSVRP